MLDAADTLLVPTALNAVTENVYETPFVKPVMVQLVVEFEQLRPPGEATAVYATIGSPLSAPPVHVSETC